MGRFILFLGIHFYSGVMECIKATLPLLKTKSAKIRKLHVKERSFLPGADAPQCGSTVVWIHASSLGESKVVIKFITTLKEKYPDTRYVLTAITESGVEYLRRHRDDSVCAVDFLPFDTIPLMRRMIRRYDIRRVWLVETEIWPSMLWVCLTNSIPVGVVNGRMEEKSFRLYHIFHFVLRFFFDRMEAVLAQDKTYADRFIAMGAPAAKVHITGNIKSRMMINPPSTQQKHSLRAGLGITPAETVITVGCIHPQEALIIKDAADILDARGYRWKWIVLPRHIDKSQLILKELGESTTCVKKMDLSHTGSRCLIEMYGIMEDMYMIADGAVLGGTFVSDVGGHNIWEAVQFSIPVFFGPYYYKQQQSYDRVLAAGVGFCVRDAAELAQRLIATVKDDSGALHSKTNAFRDTMKKNVSPLESYLP